MRKTLLWALLLSLSLHLAWLALPDFLHLPTSQPPARFDAVLLPPPPAAAPAAPQQTTRPNNRKPATTPTTATAPANSAEETLPPPEPKPEPQPQPVTQTEPAKTSDRQLPTSLELVFDLIKGTQGLIVGRVTHQLRIENGQYQLTSTAEATGLFSLVKSGQLVQKSRGRITAGGLQPQQFIARRGSKPPEQADFDWDNGQLRYGKSTEPQQTVPLADGSLDILSFIYQFALSARPDRQFDFYMTNGRGFLRQQYEAGNIEEIDTPLGPQQALLVRRTGGDGQEKVDIWLGVAQHYLPLRIRFTDKNGEVAEQHLRILRTGTPAEPQPATAASATAKQGEDPMEQ